MNLLTYLITYVNKFCACQNDGLFISNCEEILVSLDVLYYT